MTNILRKTALALVAGAMMTGSAMAGQFADQQNDEQRREACMTYASGVALMTGMATATALVKDADDLISLAILDARGDSMMQEPAILVNGLGHDRATVLADNLIALARAHRQPDIATVAADCQAGTLDFLDNTTGATAASTQPILPAPAPLVGNCGWDAVHPCAQPPSNPPSALQEQGKRDSEAVAAARANCRATRARLYLTREEADIARRSCADQQ